MDSVFQSLAQFFKEGGFWVYPIIAASACAIAVALERSYYFYIHSRVDAKALLTQVTRMVRNGETEKARQLSSKMKTPLAIMVESALWHYLQQESEQEIQNAIDELALR